MAAAAGGGLSNGGMLISNGSPRFHGHRGARRRFVPDVLVRLASGRTLVLEIKGEDSEQNRAKRCTRPVPIPPEGVLDNYIP